MASIHYLDIPSETASIKDEAVGRTVGRMQKVVELGRTARNNRQFTLKQPLTSLLVIHQDVQFLDDVRGLASYVREAECVCVGLREDDRTPRRSTRTAEVRQQNVQRPPARPGT